MLEKNNSLIAAEKVLNLLLADSRAALYEGSIGTFQNGREQGFKLNYYPTDEKGNDTRDIWAISWAENRSSDDIVVYHGPTASHGAYQKAYKNAKYFKWDEEPLVVEYIFNLLEENQAERS